MNKYVSFISDADFKSAVSHLYDAYVSVHKSINEKSLYENKLDVIKLTCDQIFESLDEQSLINREIQRQADKRVNNYIGTFHEEILGSISGYERGNLSGWDIKAVDDSLFAEVKNKHNTVNGGSREAVYQKLERFANIYPNSKCYYVQVLAKSSFNNHWKCTLDKGKQTERTYNHPRVYEISGDLFYAMLSKQPDALCQIYKALPNVINDVLTERGIIGNSLDCSKAMESVRKKAGTSCTLLNQMSKDNFPYYEGFKDL